MRLPASGYRAMPWKNGQGITHEIAREPVAGDSFLWRLSIAEVAADGDFSLFPGIDRTISLIEGAGMALDFTEAPAKRIDAKFQPFDFSGDWHCCCRLIDGPIRDFNLMVDRSRVKSETRVLGPGDAARELDVGPGRLLVYCGAGEVGAGGFTAAAGDTLSLGPGRYRIEGRGATALVMQLHMLRGR
jgi:environmental stress-induced protein Ves